MQKMSEKDIEHEAELLCQSINSAYNNGYNINITISGLHILAQRIYMLEMKNEKQKQALLGAKIIIDKELEKL